MAPYENSTRAIVVCLKATGKSSKEVSAISGIPTRTVNSIYARAIERGFEPCERPMKLLDKHLEDAPRSGRPSKQTNVSQKGALSQDGLNISASTVCRILKKMMEDRYKW
ncbi:hypothetical protein BCR34DRAFT_336222 [Clohesyomyces aquaticus]|uniref:Uncharacterized protein n=1 Tax=Clohesyomyces aquaticus TaxID=1231657 RepID=A0A1Y1ZLA8_9PLEO|nr:hypothetical protein BCR34DRAFT_336222 [Clohesyomyces aquaticus]